MVTRPFTVIFGDITQHSYRSSKHSTVFNGTVALSKNGRDGVLRNTLGRSVGRSIQLKWYNQGGLSRIVHVASQHKLGRWQGLCPRAKALSDHSSLIASHEVAPSIERLHREVWHRPIALYRQYRFTVLQ